MSHSKYLCLSKLHHSQCLNQRLLTHHNPCKQRPFSHNSQHLRQPLHLHLLRSRVQPISQRL